MIETICNNCGNIRVFEDSYAGRKFKCPVCGGVVEIKPTDTGTVPTKDETSNKSIETMVTKKRQELSDAQKNKEDKEKKKQKQREKEDAKIEKELQKRLDFSLGQFKREKVLAYFFTILYIAVIIFCIYMFNLEDQYKRRYGGFDETTNFIVGLACIYAVSGWILAGRYVGRYRDHKKGWFGGSNDCVFTEDCKEITRQDIIRELYPKRYEEDQAKEDMELEKSINQVKKLMYKLDHPEEE